MAIELLGSGLALDVLDCCIQSWQRNYSSTN